MLTGGAATDGVLVGCDAAAADATGRSVTREALLIR